MAITSRSGRVTIEAGQKKTVIAAGLVGSATAIYRFFNSGRQGATIKILKGTALLATVEWKDSVDVPVKTQEIVVEAGTENAEVVYDFLGLA